MSKETTSSALRSKRLTFVSGSVIGWGIVLLRLFPATAELQTEINLTPTWSGLHVRFNDPASLAFHCMFFLLCLGAVTVCLSVAYIVAYGASLISCSSEIGWGSSVRSAAKTICNYTYSSVFWINGVFFASLALLAPPAFAGGAAQEYLREAKWLSGGSLVAVGSGIQVLLIVAFILLAFKFRSIVQNRARLLRAIVIPALIVFLGLVVTRIRAATYTLVLSQEKPVVDPSDGKPVVFFVKLGGATGDVGGAEVEVWQWHSATTDSAETFEKFAGPLPLAPLGDGQYVCSLPAAKVVPGVFEAKLTYDRVAFGLQYPYVHGDTSRVAGFIVIGEEIDKD